MAISDDHQPASSLCFVDSVVPAVYFQFHKIFDEVVNQLLHLDVRKATGPDDISAFFLKAVASEIAEPLTVLFNQSLATGLNGSFQMSLPSIRVEQRTIQGNFIQYLVVPIMAKVLEKLIANHLSSYLESHSLLHDHQGAYWSGRSSEHILLFAVDTS